jgi:hypothetical protein
MAVVCYGCQMHLALLQMVPTGLIRRLATRKYKLDDDEDDDEDGNDADSMNGQDKGTLAAYGRQHTVRSHMTTI